MTNMYANDLLNVAKKRAIISVVLSTVLLIFCVGVFVPSYSPEDRYFLCISSILIVMIGSMLPLRSHYVHRQTYLVEENSIKVFYNKKQKQVIQSSYVKGIVISRHVMGIMSQEDTRGGSISQTALSISLLDYGNVEQVIEKIHARYFCPQLNHYPPYDNAAVKSALGGRVLYSCQYSEQVWCDFLMAYNGVIIVPLSLYVENEAMFRELCKKHKQIEIYTDDVF